ncbi:MAG: OmpA family protein [Spirochaetota bacterium]
MRKYSIRTALLTLAVVIPLSAEMKRIPGGDLIDFIVPFSAHYTLSSSPTPFSYWHNPALIAEGSLIAVEGMYTFVGSDSAGTVGAVIPTRAGSLFAAFRYCRTGGALGAGLGELNGATVGFAKHFGPMLSLGAGLTFLSARYTPITDFGLAGDLGMVLRTKGSITIAKDIAFGLALENFGKQITYGQTNYDAFPAWDIKFSLSGESPVADFLSFNSGIDVKYYPLSLSQFSFVVKTEAVILSNFFIAAGLILNEKDVDIWHIGAGAGFTLPTMTIKARYALTPRLYTNGARDLVHSVALIVGFGQEDSTPPELSYARTAAVYFSPGNTGAMETFVVTPVIRDASPLSGWQLIIKNADGEIVRTFEEVEDRLTEFDGDKFLRMLVSERMSVDAPASIEWDGTDTNGITVPDGRYTYVMRAKDEGGKTGWSAVNTVTVDASAPRITVDAPANAVMSSRAPLSFSNHVDELYLSEVTSEIRDNNGVQIRMQRDTTRESILTLAPGSLPSGVYSYTVRAADSASNSAVFGPVRFEVDNGDMRLSVIPEKRGFSPAIDSLTFHARPTPSSSVQKALFTAENESRNVVFSFATNTFPSSIVWGKEQPRSSDLLFLPEGRSLITGGLPNDGVYAAVLSVTLENGLTITSPTVSFIVDSTPPAIDLAVPNIRFSPDADGINDTLPLRIKVSDKNAIARWEIVITETRGETNAPFKRFSGRSAVDKTIVWTGRSDTGELVESANDYSIVLVAMDEFGNTSRTRASIITTDILVVKTARGYKMKVSNIEFDTGKDTLTKRSRALLDRVAEILGRYSRYAVSIEGHTDNVGGRDYNQKLSDRRSERVRDHLSSRGVDAKRLTAHGNGETSPAYSNNDEWGRARNRRVEFLLERNSR